MGDDPVPIPSLGQVYGRAGRRAEAQKVLDQLIERSRRGEVPAVAKARVYEGLGEKDRAFEWPGKAVEERSPLLAQFLKTDALFDRLRPDPRFTDLLRQMNLTP